MKESLLVNAGAEPRPADYGGQLLLRGNEFHEISAHLDDILTYKRFFVCFLESDLCWPKLSSPASAAEVLLGVQAGTTIPDLWLNLEACMQGEPKYPV